MCNFQGHHLKCSNFCASISEAEAAVRRNSNGGDGGGGDGDAHGGDGAHASEPWAWTHQVTHLFQAEAPSLTLDEAQKLMWHHEAWHEHVYCDCSAKAAAGEQEDSTSWLGDAHVACLICGSAETWEMGGAGHQTSPDCHDQAVAIDIGQSVCHVWGSPETAPHRVSVVCDLKSDKYYQ